MWRLRRRRATTSRALPQQVWLPPAPHASALAAADSPPSGPARPGPRVELGFADGAVAELDPESPAARALAVVARSLVGEPPAG